MADVHPQPGALPVAPVVMAQQSKPAFGEVVEHVEVAARVLGETVDEEQDRSSISFGSVSPPEEAVAVRAFQSNLLRSS